MQVAMADGQQTKAARSSDLIAGCKVSGTVVLPLTVVLHKLSYFWTNVLHSVQPVGDLSDVAHVACSQGRPLWPARRAFFGLTWLIKLS